LHVEPNDMVDVTNLYHGIKYILSNNVSVLGSNLYY
jgi:hypothetical protein